MREYTVRAGDSTASIAAEHAGCPKCARDLIRANPHKASITYPNGYTTFESLVEGETLNLPDKWESKEFDLLPRSYFAALPSSDGSTPSSLGALAAGVLGDFDALDDASNRVGALGAMGGMEFSTNVGEAADAVERAVSDIGRSPDVDATLSAVAVARSKYNALDAAIASGDSDAEFNVRSSILHNLSDGLVAARSALNAAHSQVPASTAPVRPSSGAVPQAVVALVGIDPCASVNVAVVCAAQKALGTPIDGKYGDGTASAARLVVPNAPSGCSPRPSWWRGAGVSNCPGAVSKPPVPPSSPTSPSLPSNAASSEKGLSVASVVGLGLLGVGTVGGAIYLTTRKRPKSSKSSRARARKKQRR